MGGSYPRPTRNDLTLNLMKVQRTPASTTPLPAFPKHCSLSLSLAMPRMGEHAPACLTPASAPASAIAQGEGGCYAQRQSAGQRVSDQRETPRVGHRNRVWGLVKPRISSNCVTAWGSGGLRLARSLRGCVRSVNAPGGFGVPRNASGVPFMGNSTLLSHVQTEGRHLQ